MGAVVLTEPGDEARTGSKRRYVLPALLVLGWAGLFAYSALYLTEDLPFRPRPAETKPAPKPFGRRLVMLDASDGSVPDTQGADAVREETGPRSLSQAPPSPQTSAGGPVAPSPLRAPGSLAGAEFVGIWGPTADACAARSRRRGYLPATITQDRARAGRTICTFRDTRRAGNAWLMAAECSDRGRRWSSHVRLVVDGDRLTWSSGRGTTAYVRCGRRGG